jgi:arylsulfatase A-like enzyme
LATLSPPRKPPAPPIWKDHLRTIKGVDKNVGRLLDALDELELADNTLVIFTSDNGYYFGEHLLGDKRSAYEESIRVPLLVRLPGRINPGTVSDELVLNIDLAPTIMDIAVENTPEAMQGSSMRPLLSQVPVDWREAFLYEYWQGNTFWLPPRRPRTPSILAVRTRTHKLITYPDYGKWTQLFDLEADPYETRNIVGYDSEIHRHIEMCDLLQQVLAETDFVDRPSLNKWLLGLTDSYYTMQSHGRMPEIIPRPPLIYPNC